ncbi:MAG: hypothetical protein ACFFD4_18350 [Candidatus Odinarchaeota archaeon]
MASQFVTFLLIFALGLAMVVVVNDIFSGLTDQMRDSASKPEIEDIITGLKTTVIDSYLLIKNGEEGSITVALDKLPTRLSGQYPYEITSFAKDIDDNGTLDVYYLNLTVDKITKRETITVSTGLTVEEVDLSINLRSIVTTHYLTTAKTSTGIAIKLDDS